MINFDPVVIPDISDLIIIQISKKIEKGELKPGEQLPSEITMQKLLNVTKQQIKTALKKLEVYHVVTTKPQSGTFIADVNSKILVGILRNIVDIKPEKDPLKTFEIRTMLELKAVEECAINCTKEEIEELFLANKFFNRRKSLQSLGMEEDIIFHQEIVRFSHDPGIISLYTFLIFDFLDFWKSFNFTNEEKKNQRMKETYTEHNLVINAIKARDSSRAVKFLREHLSNGYTLIKEYRQNDSDE